MRSALTGLLVATLDQPLARAASPRFLARVIRYGAAPVAFVVWWPAAPQVTAMRRPSNPTGDVISFSYETGWLDSVAAFQLNPAGVFYKRGIIESWGRGTQKMAELTRNAGLPRPEFLEVPGALIVRFRPSRYLAPHHVRRDLTVRQRTILVALGERGSLSLGEIQGMVPNDARRALQRDLAFLRDLALVEMHGWGRGSRWRLGGGGEGI